MAELDAVVVGAGPNGLAAAVVMARAGLRVRLYERESTIGGGARTAELTLPGFLHDVCSAVHPMALASPFFRAFGLADRIDLRVPEISFAHPLDGGRAGIAYRDLARTVDALGRDGTAYRRLVGALSSHPAEVAAISGTSVARVPSHPLVLASLGVAVLEQGGAFWNSRFSEDVAPAMLTGAFAHANRALPDLGAAAAGLVLVAHAHAAGWPVPVGGSQTIVDALAADFTAHGGEIQLDSPVGRLASLPPARAVLLDVTPRALHALAGDTLPGVYSRMLDRYRYGNAVAKVDFALDGPVPWANAELAQASTLHLGGTRAEIAAAEHAVAAGRLPESPYVLVAAAVGLGCDARARGQARALGVHPRAVRVDRGSTGGDHRPDRAVRSRVSRPHPRRRPHRPRSRSSGTTPTTSAATSAPAVSRSRSWWLRPTLTDPWSTPLKGVYLCSASTAPGPGVHGMAGFNAAKRALAREFGVRELPSLR